MNRRTLTKDQLFQLLRLFGEAGYRVIAPVRRDHTLVLDELEDPDRLPVGVKDEQSPGHYALRSDTDSSLFHYNLTADSWKQFLFPQETELFSIDHASLQINRPAPPKSPLLFFGIRGCELAALAVQDRVFFDESHRDSIYAARRESLFLFGIECVTSADSCFCTSAGTGPAIKTGFDLVLTEIAKGGEPLFVIRSGSPRGEEFLARINAPEASAEDGDAASNAVSANGASQRRSVPFNGLDRVLSGKYGMENWSAVADRCLSCTNCTLACPTCFCSDVEDVVHYTGTHSSRVRKWDSCFRPGHSYIHGTTVHPSIPSRYRQWMLHKFSTWVDQFGTSGCTGCGRCVTWCPAAIDVTEEIDRIVHSENTGGKGNG